MNGPSAILLNGLRDVCRFSTALQAILEPHFSVKILPQPAILNDTVAGGFVDQMKRLNPSIVFLLPHDGLASGMLELLKVISRSLNSIPIIVVIESCEPQDVLELLQNGAADFLTPPFRSSDVLPRTWKLLSRGAEIKLPSSVGLQQLIGSSPEFVAQVKRIPLLATCEVNVLLLGETGTGKEVYARAIHYRSPRAGKPFLPVNCGAIPLELVENELFGHERGAYTNASACQTGLIEEASGGTLFLDEIDCLPVLAQVKLLRFLQEKEYKPLGSTRTRRADVRIIAASNLDLQEAVGNGKFRHDLFYRLNTISLALPPLRERREDIPVLARHFQAKYATEFGRQITEISSEALHLLTTYNWPGNVRELEHVIERAIVLCEGSVLEAADLVFSGSTDNGRRESLQEAKAKEIARFEKNYIQGVLCACKGNITKAAQVAQKNRRAFWQLIKKHQIDVSKFRRSIP